MATISTSQFLDGGTARTANEAFTINTGAVFTIRTDGRVHANAPGSMTGTLGAITVTEGECFIDATKTRWLAYTGGSGNVPAIGTNITQAGVTSSYLLGVWASMTAAPTAVGVAMPPTGFIKFREVTGAFAAGALTGIGATASGADVTGWIEIALGAVDITVPRLGKFKTRGDWFYLDNTTGTRGQTLQVPLNGGGSATYACGCWVETAPASGVYEQWPGLNNANGGWSVIAMGAAEGFTDARQKFVRTQNASSIMQFGETVTYSSTYISLAAQASSYVDWNVSGTYTLTDNLCTVFVAAGHGLYGGETIGFDFTTGTATDQTGVATVLDAYYLTVPITAANTSGNVTVRLGVSVTFTAHGQQEGCQVGLTVSTGTLPTGTYTVHSMVGANGYYCLYPHTTALTSGNCSALHTLTVTRTAHGKSVGNDVYLNFTTGGATSGRYFMRAVAANTFNVNFPHFAAIASSNVTERYEIGLVPPAGCKVRIPNILMRSATTATNLVPNATLATRPEFITTSAGAIDMEYVYGENLYARFGQAYSLNINHAAFLDNLEITECATAPTVNDTILGTYTGSNTILPLYVASCFSGGSFTNCKFHRQGTPGASGHSVHFAACSDMTISNVESGVLLYPRSSGYFLIDNCSGFTISNTRAYNTEFRLASCINTSVTNHDHVDRFIGNTNATTGLYAASNRFGNGNTIDGLTFGLNGTIPNCHPYLGAVLGEYSKNSKYRNIGTPAAPLNGGTWEASAYNMSNLYLTGLANANTIKIQRCFATKLRGNGLIGQSNSDKNFLYETIISKEPYCHTANTIANRWMAAFPSTINCETRGLTGIMGAAQASVYGNDYMSNFMGTAFGTITLCMNEPTTQTAAYFTMVSGTAKFNSAGGIIMGVIGNQAIWEMPYFALGHTGFVNSAAIMSGGTIGQYTLEYQINTGSGYSAWQTLSGANLSAETITPSVGFKLKIRITTSTTNTAAITFLRINTTTTETAQSTNFYPLDTNTVTFTGLPTGCDAVVLTAGTSTILDQKDALPTTTYAYSFSGAQTIDVGFIKPGYIPFYIRNLALTATDSAIPVSLTLDRNYQ